MVVVIDKDGYRRYGWLVKFAGYGEYFLVYNHEASTEDEATTFAMNLPIGKLLVLRGMQVEKVIAIVGE